VCSFEHTIRACVFYRTHTLLSIHLDILNPQDLQNSTNLSFMPIEKCQQMQMESRNYAPMKSLIHVIFRWPDS
jgi:hypothetical protein